MIFTIASLFVPSLGTVPVLDVVYNPTQNTFLVGADILDHNPRKRIWTFDQFEDVVQFGARNGLTVQAENSNLAQDVLRRSVT